VGLTLNSVTSPEDVEALKERAVAARLDQFQKAQGISDPAVALRRYYQANVKDAQLPKTVEDQLALLRKREPVPTAPLEELRRQRLQVTRDRLAKVEGIAEARLQAAPEATPGATTGTAPSTTPPPAGPSAAAPPAAAPPAATSPPAGPSATTPPSSPAPASAEPGSAAAPPGAAEAPPLSGRVEFGITGESD
jgi:hypothetical protein